MNEDAFNTLLRAGVAAPSADNSQPWKFKLGENEIDVFIDPTRAGKVSDARFLLTDISIGGVIENLVVQSKCMGYNARVTLFPSGESDHTLHCARLALGTSGDPRRYHKRHPQRAYGLVFLIGHDVSPQPQHVVNLFRCPRHFHQFRYSRAPQNHNPYCPADCVGLPLLE